MKTSKSLSLELLCFISLLFFSGCAGPKIMSNVVASEEIWGQLPKIQSISIRQLFIFSDNDTLTAPLTTLLLENIKERLIKSGNIDEVEILSSTDSVRTKYLLEVSPMNTGQAGWGTRAVTYGSQSEVSIAGRIIDVEADKAIITFRKTRMAQGGILGLGGWLAAGEKKMSQKLIEWLADDVVKMLLSPSPTSNSNTVDQKDNLDENWEN